MSEEKKIYQSYGIDISKLNKVAYGDLNIIVSIFGAEEGDNTNEIFARVYQPRKARIKEYDVLQECEGDKNLLADWLDESAERLKILSFLIKKQAQELRDKGIITTTSYYADSIFV